MSVDGIHLQGEALHLSGSVDFDTVPKLVEGIRAAADARLRVIDAAAVTRIDSAGLAFLVWCRRNFAADGGTVALRGAPDQLARLVAVTGLQDLFEVDPTH